MATTLMGAAFGSGRYAVPQDEAPDSPPPVIYGQSVANPRIPGAIRIATYNLLNLFDHQDNPDLQGDYDDMLLAISEERASALAQSIRAIDADIIAVQEIESKEALEWFRDTYLSDAGYDFLESFDVGHYRGIENAVLSRFPITSARIWTGISLDDVPKPGHGWTRVPEAFREGLEFQRSPLRVDIRINDEYELTLFSIHHKAGTQNRWHRESEAVKIVEFIQEIEHYAPDRNLVVLGDFNAAPWDKSMRVYREAGLIDTLSHRIIPRWDPTEDQKQEANLYKTHSSGHTIDYVLLNSAAIREFVVGSAFVYGTVMPPDGYNWRTDPIPGHGYASDHYPVVIDLTPQDR